MQLLILLLTQMCICEILWEQVCPSSSLPKRSSIANLFAAVFSNKAKTPNTLNNSILFGSKSLQ